MWFKDIIVFWSTCLKVYWFVTRIGNCSIAITGWLVEQVDLNLWTITCYFDFEVVLTSDFLSYKQRYESI
jgi:hypothetical protein